MRHLLDRRGPTQPSLVHPVLQRDHLEEVPVQSRSLSLCPECMCMRCQVDVPSVSLAVPESSGHRVRSGAVPEVFTVQAREHAGNPVEESVNHGWW